MGMQLIDVFLADFGPNSGPIIAALAQRMIRENLSPEDILRAYEEHIYAARSRYNSATEPKLSCPVCAAVLEAQPLCPHTSPHWRTAIACSKDDCAYHGLSTRPLDYLLRNGLDSVEER